MNQLPLNKNELPLIREMLTKYKQGYISGLIPGSNITFSPSGCRNKIISSTGGGGSSYIPPFLKTGGASWSGTGLVYDVTALEYYFNGDKTTSATQVTLDASDPVNNRLDAIVVDEAGVVSVIKGDASASPISPSVDESHILVQYILVEAGSTQPTIAKEDIYLENVEWTTSTYTTGTATGSIDFDNAVSPKQGVKCISANADARLGARFVRTTSFDPYQYTMLSMWVRFTGSNVATNKSLNVRFENGAGTLVGNTINLFNYGLQRNTLNTWQLVVVPITAFGALPATVKGLKVIMSGGTVGQARQWDIDYMILTNGSVPYANVPTIAFYKDDIGIASQSGINLIEGTGVTIDAVNNPLYNRVDYTINSSGGGIESIVAGTNITIDNTDPLNPIINGSSLLFPNGREIITSSRDFQQSDEGKILIVVGNNIALTMPDASIWTEVGIPIGLKFLQGYTGCSYEAVHGLPIKVLQLSSDGEFITVITGEYLGKSNVGTIADMIVNTDDGDVTLNKYLYDQSQNAIPLTGTEAGKPVTGDVSIQDDLLWSLKNNQQEIVFNDDGSGVQIIANSSTEQGILNIGSNSVSVSSTDTTSRGISGVSDFTANITDLDYTQKIYVGFRGTATLSSGTVIVATDKIKTGYKIYVSVNTPSGTQGFLSAPTGSIVDATSFVINSTNAGDNSTVNWWIAP